MKKNNIVFITGNIIPILFSIIMFLTLSNTNFYTFWVGYDALIVPLYLLLFNFFYSIKEFYIWKILIVLVIEVICIIIHMYYFDFDLSATSFIIWLFVVVISFVIIGIGGAILYITSKKRAL